MFKFTKPAMMLRQQQLITMNQLRYFALVHKYTKTHEWIKYDTNTKVGKVGITEHAQKELGDIVHVDMPEIGSKYEPTQRMVAVESTKTAADVYAMVTCEVVTHNNRVKVDAGICN